jgi:hypothetical protein
MTGCSFPISEIRDILYAELTDDDRELYSSLTIPSSPADIKKAIQQPFLFYAGLNPEATLALFTSSEQQVSFSLKQLVAWELQGFSQARSWLWQNGSLDVLLSLFEATYLFGEAVVDFAFNPNLTCEALKKLIKKTAYRTDKENLISHLPASQLTDEFLTWLVSQDDFDTHFLLATIRKGSGVETERLPDEWLLSLYSDGVILRGNPLKDLFS